MNALTVPNGVAVALFGIALSAAFCDIHWTKKNRIILAVGSAAILLMQALITYMDSWTAMQETYPLITHLPLAIILSVLSGKWLWPTISVLAAYLCCQLRRWVALLVIAMVPGIDWLQPAVEIVVTLPLLAVLLRRTGPDMALLLALAVCGAGLALLLEPLGALRDFWEEAAGWGDLPMQLFAPLVKTVGIALVSRTGSDVCRDAGEGGLASFTETAGAALALFVALPLLEAVLQTVVGLL